MGSLKIKNIFTALMAVMTIVIIISSVSYADLEIAGHYADRFAGEANTNPNELLDKVFAADRDFDEVNELCIGGPDGGGPAVSRLRITGIIDINYDGPNTATIYKKGKEPMKLTKETNEKDILYFNAMAKVVAESKGPRQTANDIYGAAFSKFMYVDLRPYFKYALGVDPVPSVGWEAVPGAMDYIRECEEHGKEVLTYTIDGGFKVSDKYNPDDAGCESISSTSEDVYVGPFTYSAKQKVDFGNIEVNGTDDGKTVYTETIDKVTSEKLFVKDSSGFKGVNFVEPETQFYVKVNKKIDEASKVQVKITSKGNNNYYKARIAVLAAEGVPTQNTVIYTGEYCGKGGIVPTANQIVFEFENNKGNLEINKSGIYLDKKVNKVENMGYKIYYLEGSKKQYLKITTDTKLKNEKLVGDITVKKQEPTSEKDATIIYTDASGQILIRKINSKYEYYLEEISDDCDYSKNAVEATQTINGKETNILNGTVIGPITVERRSKSPATYVKICDDIKRGNMKIVKVSDKGEKLARVEFKIRAKSGLWISNKIASDGKGNYQLKTYKDFASNKKYYEDNFTADESEAATFVTNNDGEITINGLDKGTYIVTETANRTYGYYSYEEKIITGATVNGKATKIDKNTIEVEVEGNDDITENVEVKIINEKQTCEGPLKIVKKDQKTGEAISNVEFAIQKYNEDTSSYEYIMVSKNDYIAGEDWVKEDKVTGAFRIGSMKYTKNLDEATKFITDTNGIIELDNILKGKYNIIETANNHYGYYSYEDIIITEATINGKPASVDKNIVAVELDGEEAKKPEIEVIIINEKQVLNGPLKIIKKDQKTGEAISDVTFDIQKYNKEKDTYEYIMVSKNDYIAGEDWVKEDRVTGKFKIGSIKFTTNPEEATIFVTDADGIIELDNLLKGKYNITELADYHHGYYDVEDFIITGATLNGKTVEFNKNIVTVDLESEEADKLELIIENEDNRGILDIQKTGVKTGQFVSAVENMGFKIYYLEGDKKQYLKIETDAKLVDGKYVGDVKIKKQSTTDAEGATIIYTDGTGHTALFGIDTRFEYYLEEISDDCEYSKNVVEATQTINGIETNILNDGAIGPIKVEKRRKTPATFIKICDDIKRGNMKIVKVSDKGEKLARVEFKIKAQSGLWISNKVTSDGKGNYQLKTYKDFASNKKYYEDNFTADESEAATFVTNSDGEITINGLDKGTYIVTETANRTYGYYSYEEKIITEATVNGKSTKIDKNNIEVEVEGNDEATATVEVKIINEKQTCEGPLKIVKKDQKTGEAIPNVEFAIQKYNEETNAYEYIMVSKNDYIAGEDWVKEDSVTGSFKIGSMKYTTNLDEATKFITDTNGIIELDNILKGRYNVIEIANNHYGYYSYEDIIITEATINGKPASIDKNIVTVELDGEEAKKPEIELIIKNEKQVLDGPFKLVKKDKETGRLLADVTFNIQRYNEETNAYEYIMVSRNDYLAGEDWIKEDTVTGSFNIGSMKYTTNQKDATLFVTDDSGVIELDNLLLGKYKVNEISVGKNYGYTPYDDREDIDPEYVYWIDAEGKEHLLRDEEIVIEIQNDTRTTDSGITITIENKMKYLNITGKVWEDMLGGKANDYEAYGKDTYADGDRLVEGLTVRLKDKDGNILKITTTNGDGNYEFNDVLIKDLNKYLVEFEYNGFTYTTVATLVGDNQAVNSKAGEVVEQRKSLNSAYAEITNKDNINDRSHGYSRNVSGGVAGELTYSNDIENWISRYEGTNYDNKTYSGTNLTANTDIAGYSLNEQYVNKNYIIREDGSFEIQYVNLGIVGREQPQISISDDIENAKVDVNGYSHTYLYAQRNSKVDDESAFNVAVKFGKEYVSGYTRAIYPSDVQFSNEAAKDDDARKLKVYVTYAVTIRNVSNTLKMGVDELVNYYDKNYTIVDSWLGDGKKINWNNTSKYGQSYNDGKYVGSYTTSLADTKINAGENIKVYIQFRVSDEAVLNLLNETATLNNTTEIFSYSTYYGTNKEGCAEGDIYAAIDTASAPGNAKPGDKNTYEADTDDAPSLLLEAKGVRELAGTVFEDSTSSELRTGEERLGDGIYNDGENIVSGVTVELLRAEDLALATIYPPKDTDTAEGTEVSTADSGREAKLITTADGKYIFRGIEPDKYLLRYTYENGVTKIFDTTGKEVKDVTVQGYKSTIIASDKIKEAFQDNENHLRWFVETEKEGRYSDAKDDYELRQKIDEELATLDSKDDFANKQIDANTPKFEVGVEKESIYTASTGDRYSHLTENIDFGIVERPRQAAMLDKEVAYLKVTLPNGQVLIDGDPRKDNLDYVNITKDPSTGKIKEIYITIDSELIYGSHLEIKYDYTLTNTSELDYTDESYYYYGEGGKTPVKFTSATLLDFVDSEIVLKAGQEGTWQVLDLAKEGLELSPAEREALLKNFSTLVTAEAIPTGVSIASGESVTASIFVEKILANKDELTYENNGEIIKLSKTGGSTLTTNFGNYAKVLAKDPESDEVTSYVIEPDEARSDKVTIIPPTGTTDNTTLYVIIGATCLVVLGAGIFGIKRFLKK